MQMHGDFGALFRRRPDCPRSVPMSLLSEQQAQWNHSQSLARLNERGGLCPMEMLCNIERRSLDLRMNEDYAIDRIKDILKRQSHSNAVA